MEGNSRGGGSFPVLRDPHLENSEGEADAAIRLVRLHGVAGGEQEGQRLTDRGVEDHPRGVGNSSATEAVSRLSWGGIGVRLK